MGIRYQNAVGRRHPTPRYWGAVSRRQACSNSCAKRTKQYFADSKSGNIYKYLNDCEYCHKLKVG